MQAAVPIPKNRGLAIVVLILLISLIVWIGALAMAPGHLSYLPKVTLFYGGAICLYTVVAVLAYFWARTGMSRPRAVVLALSLYFGLPLVAAVASFVFVRTVG